MQNSETDKAVAKVIESAGKYAPELWTEMVAAARLDAIMDMVLLAFFGVALLVLAACSWTQVRSAKKNNEGGDAEFIWACVGWTALLFSWVFIASSVQEIDRVLYPQAAVVQSILK